MMAEEMISKYGYGGFIKFEQFIGMVPEDQVK